MAVDDDNSSPVAASSQTEAVTTVEPFGESPGSSKVSVVSDLPPTRRLSSNVIRFILQHPRASVSYLPLFLIRGVDTNSRAYLKSTRVIPEVTAVTSSSKRPRSSLTIAHKVLSNDAAGNSNIWSSSFFHTYISTFIATKTFHEQEEAVRALIDSSLAATRTRPAYQSRLASLNQDRTDYFFRMTYFHALYIHNLQEIKEVEAALAALPSETIELD